MGNDIRAIQLDASAPDWSDELSWGPTDVGLPAFDSDSPDDAGLAPTGAGSGLPAFLESNVASFELDLGRGETVGVGLGVGELGKWEAGFGSKLQFGDVSVKLPLLDVDVSRSLEDSSGQSFGLPVESVVGPGGKSLQIGPYIAYEPERDAFAVADGHGQTVTENYFGYRPLKVGFDDLGPLGGKIADWLPKGYKLEGSLELQAGAGYATRRDPRGELDGVHLNVTPGIKSKGVVGGVVGLGGRGLKIEGGFDHRRHGAATVSLDKRDPDNVAALNFGSRDAARAHLEHIAATDGLPGLVNQSLNQHYHAEDGRMLNHGSAKAAQVQDAIRTLAGTEIDGRALLPLEDWSGERKPSPRTVLDAVEAAIDEGVVPPEAFAGEGGYDFGQERIAEANRDLHGVDGPGRDVFAEPDYPVLPDPFHFDERGIVSDRSNPFLDRNYPADGFVASVIDAPESVTFPGLRETAGRLANDLGEGAWDLIGDAQDGYERTYDAIDDAITDARARIDGVGDRVREDIEGRAEDLGDRVGDAVRGARKEVERLGGGIADLFRRDRP